MGNELEYLLNTTKVGSFQVAFAVSFLVFYFFQIGISSLFGYLFKEFCSNCLKELEAFKTIWGFTCMNSSDAAVI